jgi:hypothetical protein
MWLEETLNGIVSLENAIDFMDNPKTYASMLIRNDHPRAIIMDIEWDAVNNLGISQSLVDGAL